MLVQRTFWSMLTAILAWSLEITALSNQALPTAGLKPFDDVLEARPIAMESFWRVNLTRRSGNGKSGANGWDTERKTTTEGESVQDGDGIKLGRGKERWVNEPESSKPESESILIASQIFVYCSGPKQACSCGL